MSFLWHIYVFCLQMGFVTELMLYIYAFLYNFVHRNKKETDMEYDKLCRAVEQHLHREMRTPADFDYLSEQIMNKTSSSLSSTTLMRLWGYRRSSATVRIATLDILARFIDYKDYTHFRSEEQEDPGIIPPPSPAGKEQSHLQTQDIGHSVFVRGRAFRWLMLVLSVLLVAVVLSVIYFHRPQEESQEQPQTQYITSLSELSNNRQYLIHTRERRRGSLGICGRHLGTTFESAALFRCDKASPFAIIQHDGCFYLFSVEKGRFVNVLNYLTDKPLLRDFGERNWCAFDIHPETYGFVFDFKSTTNVYTLNVAAFDGIIIDDWGTANGFYDDGNLFSLEDAGPFDPTEALSYLTHNSCSTSE